MNEPVPATPIRLQGLEPAGSSPPPVTAAPSVPSRGHRPSLLAAFLHFEVSFAVWTVLGALGPFLAADLGLSPTQRGLVVATPLLAGAAYRVVVGWAADAYGPRRVGTITMALVLVPLAWGWLGSGTLPQILAVGLLLGVGGASFAVSLPLAAANFPPSRQGLAQGIAGAGNSGTILSALLAPRLAEAVGWQAALGAFIAPVALTALAFRLLAREAPPRRLPLAMSASPLREGDCWALCGLYAVTFGGYVGLAAFLPLLLVDAYGVSPVAAGGLAALAAGTGSLLRPLGGTLADRLGGARVLRAVFPAAAALAATIGLARGLGAVSLLFVALLGTLGIGNGAVFQLVSLRFPRSRGLVTGVVGCAGGVGGFLPPILLGAGREVVGTYAAGLLAFALAALAASRLGAVRRARRAGEVATGWGA